MQYKAFISYSHAGEPTLPSALHRSLERFAKPWYRMRSFRIFPMPSLSAEDKKRFLVRYQSGEQFYKESKLAGCR